MICKKHGNVGGLFVNVRMKDFTCDSGVNYCMVCLNELLARECCVLEDAPQDTIEAGEQQATSQGSPPEEPAAPVA